MIAHVSIPTQETLSRVCICVGLIIAFATPILSQSTLQEFPAAVTTNQINGTITARPIGDSRLTTYFYTFDATQGDVFVNVSTKNFNGDFDIFIAEGLRPLTKIVTLSGFSEYETGRVIYLRKQERLLLRVQGRTPDDEPATFQVKFAGSFVALNEGDVPMAPKLPTVSQPERTAIAERADAREAPQRIDDAVEAERVEEGRPPIKPVDQGPKTVRELPNVAERDVETSESVQEVPKVAEDGVEILEPKTSTPRVVAEDRTPETRDDTGKSIVPPRILNLVVQFLNGSKIETPMSEIRRFSVDGGRLVIVGRDGVSRRYSMNDVLKVAIE